MNGCSPTIYVATIIDSYNYGTVLQAVATRDVLERYGQPVFIDHCRYNWTWPGWIKERMADTTRSLPKRALRTVATLPMKAVKKPVFRRFVERRLPLCDATPFEEGGVEFDADAVYCVGSDQTWNYVYNYGIDPVYYLQHVPATCRKFAYAASFGRAELPQAERDETRPLLQNFEAISLRESSGVGVLESLGISGGVALKDPVLLCDPVLWDKLTVGVPKVKDDYVLVYMLNRSERMVAYARRVAAERGLQVRMIMYNTLPAPKGCKGVILPTPEEWVALFRDAKFVITDSFHGTCFSILFERPMAVFYPPKYSVRLSDVLSDFGLEKRLVPEDAPLEEIRVADESVDWARIRALKACFRAEGKAFLDSVFEGAEE